MTKKNETVSSVEKAIDILFALARTNDKTIRELSEYLNITKSSTHRILQTLKAKKLVIKNTQTDKYSLGYKLLELSSVIRRENIVRAIAIEHMKNLSYDLGDTVQLAIVENEEIIIIDIVEGTSDIRMFSRPGQVYPLTYGNFGKVYLSNMDEDSLDKYLAKLTNNGQKQSLEENIENDNYKKISVGVDTPIEGAISIAVPITNETGKVVAMISLVGIKTESKLESIDYLKEKVIECGKKISKDLSG